MGEKGRAQWEPRPWSSCTLTHLPSVCLRGSTLLSHRIYAGQIRTSLNFIWTPWSAN